MKKVLAMVGIALTVGSLAACGAKDDYIPSVQGDKSIRNYSAPGPKPAESSPDLLMAEDSPSASASSAAAASSARAASPAAESGTYDNWCRPGTTNLLAEVWSKDVVGQPPTAKSKVTFDSPVHIDAILTYHFNANGDAPGTIGLIGPDGTQYGPWPASGAEVVPAALHFCAYPDLTVPAGTYTVVDSKKSTWSQVDGPGMLKVFGSPAG